jgi:hypothetical protein
MGDNAMEWCQLVVAREAEVAEAERLSLPEDADEDEEGSEEDAWGVVVALMDGPGWGSVP